MIVLALAGPLLAGGAWAVLLPWPVARRAVGGGLALVANAAAWSVFWSAYRGDPASWRSFEAGLLGATVAATAEIGIIVAATRVERVEPRAMPAAVAALAVMASAVLAAAYAQSAAVLAVVIPLPTLAVAAVGAARRIRDLRGVAGLAAADIAALAGLTVLHARIDSVALISADFLVVGLLLAAAAVKVGAIPGLATWRLTDESGSVLAAGLRGQGLVLAAVAGVVLFRGEPEPIVAAVAAAAVALCGLATMVARTAPAALAAATGAACAVPFVALGLGGGAGVRAFLVLVPPLLLGAAAAWVLIPRDPDPAQPAPAAASGGEARSGLPVWMGAVTLGVILGSLLGAPPGGGFPGTWLTLALATARGESDPATLL
ncbi:MAG TPA: hypothetical protein VG602_04585, partial [Actinomycetota bacterium]|nr:hypothetical protein [Actinomycetota bacterium]